MKLPCDQRCDICGRSTAYSLCDVCWESVLRETVDKHSKALERLHEMLADDGD